MLDGKKGIGEEILYRFGEEKGQASPVDPGPVPVARVQELHRAIHVNGVRIGANIVVYEGTEPGQPVLLGCENLANLGESSRFELTTRLEFDANKIRFLFV